MSTYRVMLVEDHNDLRHAIALMIGQLSDVEVIAQASDGKQAIQLFEKLRPDLILMDVGMPIMNGIECCRIIRNLDSKVKVIMLTSHDNERDIFAALGAGANGYCLKDTGFERFHTAIQAVR